MRISFAGLGTPVEVCNKGATVLRVMNEGLFARVCESLLSLKGEEAVEPYSVWDDEGCEVRAANAFLVVVNPFDLPWRHRNMVGALYSALEGELMLDEDARSELQEASVALESAVHRLGFQLNGDYRFGIEWNLGSYLKTFSFEADVSESASLLDNLMSFVDFGADVGIDKALLFVNLKTFLTENELLKFNDRLVFHGISALLLENHACRIGEEVEREFVVDRDFVEYVFEKRSGCPSSSQGGFRSNGFGAVAF